jgi:hypothetical protein
MGCHADCQCPPVRTGLPHKLRGRGTPQITLSESVGAFWDLRGRNRSSVSRSAASCTAKMTLAWAHSHKLEVQKADQLMDIVWSALAVLFLEGAKRKPHLDRKRPTHAQRRAFLFSFRQETTTSALAKDWHMQDDPHCSLLMRVKTTKRGNCKKVGRLLLFHWMFFCYEDPCGSQAHAMVKAGCVQLERAAKNKTGKNATALDHSSKDRMCSKRGQ